jgi:hypothetical protein
MARVIPNEESWIAFSPTYPVAMDAPTEAELAAAIVLTNRVVSINPTSQGNALPTPALDSRFDRSIIGTRQGSFTGDFYRDDVDDLAWDTLALGVTGVFYVSRFGGSGTDHRPNTGEKVEVWPVAITQRAGSNMTSNTVQTFNVTAAVPEIPAENGIVGASAAGVPGAPRNLTVLQGATGVVELDWDAPLYAGTTAITNYKLFKSTVAGGLGAYTEVTTGLAPAHPSIATAVVASAVATGLTYFKVAAVNTAGDSSFSNIVSLTVV